MLNQIADSMNLSVPEFTKMMKDEDGLVPLDEDDNSYYEPPKRVMSVVPMSPDAARQEADRCPKLLLNPELQKREAEQIANELAQCVLAYGEFAGQPIELILYKEAMQKQVDELVASGSAREARVAQLIIIAQKAAERLMLESTTALTL